MMSEECSMPIDNRMVSGSTPARRCCSGDIWRWVVEAGWQASDFASPILTSRVISFRAFVESLAGLHAALDAKGEERRRVAVQIFLDQRVIRAVRETRIVDPIDARIVAQKLGNLARVLDMPFDAQGDGLDSLQRQESIERRKHRAHGALIDAARA